MGNFYTNFTVRGTTTQAVVDALAGRTAVVTPAVNGTVVVFDEESESQSFAGISELGADLSRALQCPVLAVVNHDDDILFYELYGHGFEVDRYCSAPGYFKGEDSASEGGNASKLCKAFGSENVSAVQAVLHPAERPTFAVEQHEQLVRHLGLPDFAVGFGFNYVSRGEFPDGLEEEDLARVG